jgi:transposase InsO family protein
MKCEAMDSLTSNFTVRRMCKVLGVRESTYYQWKKQEHRRIERRKQEESIVKKVIDAFEINDRTYGTIRLKRYLESKEIYLSEYKIRKIMRENGLYVETQSKFKPYGKNSESKNGYSDNILNQNFNVESINEVWVSDITYIKTMIGWVYLAVVIDLFNREVIGYSISKIIDTELVLKAFTNALIKSKGKQRIIFHSDRGSQYRSIKLKKLLEENGFIQSMSRKGNPYDNSCVESFFANLKKERVHRRRYTNVDEVKRDLFQYIELFYNRRRIHSKLGYVSPVEYRVNKVKIYDKINA